MTHHPWGERIIDRHDFEKSSCACGKIKTSEAAGNLSVNFMSSEFAARLVRDVCASVYAGSRHGLSIGVIIAAAACGAILGDNVGFWVGRRFGRTLLLKHGHRIGISERELILGEYLFQRYGGSIVFFGRFVAFLRVYAALLAGANRLHPLQFTKYNASGGIVWATAFGIAGYALGKNMLLFVGPLGWLALAATATGAYLLWSFYKTHEGRLLVEAERALATNENGHLGKLADRRVNQ
jgi:membrane protein DedA with SNARE-associated domain